ncbi:hypothetical protein DPMN_049114 [Dreissena polymorpha]|uniref:Uncharacterized protein n=1 Tax=Dreissena polymorpha TaxID=45954 RepID=A0A9D4I2Z9_DREPO|nr:hypothetical protein DPMN_049114 [Dreissena polymorpha]
MGSGRRLHHNHHNHHKLGEKLLNGMRSTPLMRQLMQFAENNLENLGEDEQALTVFSEACKRRYRREKQ